jgi:hypothetical protein
MMYVGFSQEFHAGASLILKHFFFPIRMYFVFVTAIIAFRHTYDFLLKWEQ